LYFQVFHNFHIFTLNRYSQLFQITVFADTLGDFATPQVGIKGKFACNNLLLYRKQACWKIHKTTRTDSKRDYSQSKLITKSADSKENVIKTSTSHKTESQDSRKTQAKSHDD